jgi:ribosomal protein L3
MRTGVIAKKLGMTRLFKDDGRHVPVTVLAQVSPRLRMLPSRSVAISPRRKSNPRRWSPNSA